MYERAITKIQRYVDEYLPETYIVYPKYEFETRSYARWAANEIIERLKEEELKLPPHISGKEPMSVLEILDEFMDLADRCVYDPKQQELWNIAYNTAKRIKCLFA